jgi:hypothetical protein
MHLSIPKRIRKQLRTGAALCVGAILLGCDSYYPESTCDVPVNGIKFTNYDGLISDSTAFLLSGLHATLNEEDVTERVQHPDAKFSARSYVFLDYDGGLLQLEMFRDSLTKARVLIEIPPATGRGCDTKATFNRYAIIWLDPVDEDGFTDVEVTER